MSRPEGKTPLATLDKQLKISMCDNEGYMQPPIVSIVAKSGTGKTTILEKLIAEFKRRGYRIGALKHDAHRFEIDREGKDSWRLTKAGADTMVISSPDKLAMVKKNNKMLEPSPSEIIQELFSDVDLVLTEGFKKNHFPKIEVNRKSRSKVLLCRGEENDPALLAVASDDDLKLDVPVFNLNDYEGICNLIEKKYLSS
jgi:molybdopterin-guanine dinucleotide biosynthesis protein MobB